MRSSIKNAVLLFVATLVFIGAFNVATRSQSLIVEGQGIDGIRIGESTEADVISQYGDNYKLIKHKSYSYEMIYKKRGLSFYYCAADPNKEIFVVEIEEPAKVVTSKGIRLGVTTMADVFRAYGKPEITSDGYEYEGVYFNVAEEDDEEDGDDAREPAQIAGKAEQSTRIEPVSQSNRTQANSVSNVNNTSFVNQIDQTPNTNSASTSTSALVEEEDSDAKEMDQVKDKIVRRIDLIERSDLRQCDTKFKAKQ